MKWFLFTGKNAHDRQSLQRPLESAVKILEVEERQNNMDINDYMRAVIIKIKAVIDDERVAEDEGIALDTRKVEGIRQLLNQFYNKHGSKIEA